MRASVIIPAYNAANTLGQCLAALYVQTLPPDEYEILVIDDGSTDATAQVVASFHSARYMLRPRGGPAAARNHGANLARGAILLFTDADCAPQPDWIGKMLAAFDDPGVVGAKGTYRTRQRALVARFAQVEYEEKYTRMARARTIDFIDTYSAAYRREVFLSVGGFDESFPTASVEDQEFSFRLARQGYQMIFVPEAIVYHQHPATLGAYARRKFWIGYWKVRVHRRHPNKLWRDSHTPPTQKAQTLFIPALLGACAAIPFWAGSVFLVLGLLAAFALSAVPLLLFIARRDVRIAFVAPGLIVLRAGALALGLAAGVAGELGWWKK